MLEEPTPLPPPTRRPRLRRQRRVSPRDISEGDSITFADRSDEWAFIKFLITIEMGQSRYYALLGNPAALLPAATLLYRY